MWIATLAAAVVLFLVAKANDPDNSRDASSVATSTTADATSTTAGDSTGGGEQSKPPEQKPPAEKIPTIEVKGGQPVGGVQELEFTTGDDIGFKVVSDVADEVHLHGYDVSQEVKAGGSTTFDVPASIEGVFEVELEEAVVPIAEVTVSPG